MSDDKFWSELESEANKDDRLGDQMFMASGATELGVWPDGRTRYKVRGVLTTAYRSRCDITLSDEPSDEEKAQKASWPKPKKRGILANHQMLEALATYGRNPQTVQEGDEFAVKVSKNEGGFLEIKHIYAKGKQVGVPSSAASDSVPF